MFLRGQCGFFLRFQFGRDPRRTDNAMSDWIDELRKTKDGNASARALAERVRFSDEALIKAKSPAFWSTIMERVKADSEKMNATFPDDDKMKSQFIQDGETTFTLENCVRPGRLFHAKFNETNLFVEIQRRGRESMEHSPQILREEMNFTLGS